MDEHREEYALSDKVDLIVTEAGEFPYWLHDVTLVGFLLPFDKRGRTRFLANCGSRELHGSVPRSLDFVSDAVERRVFDSNLVLVHCDIG